MRTGSLHALTHMMILSIFINNYEDFPRHANLVWCKVRNNCALDDRLRFQIEIGSKTVGSVHTHTLTIKAMSFGDEGSYTCSVVFNEGEAPRNLVTKLTKLCESTLQYILYFGYASANVNFNSLLRKWICKSQLINTLSRPITSKQQHLFSKLDNAKVWENISWHIFKPFLKE